MEGCWPCVEEVCEEIVSPYFIIIEPQLSMEGEFKICTYFYIQCTAKLWN